METMDYKTTAIRGFKADGGDEGVVEAIVAVTGLKDNVNDIIAPGAFMKSLNMRTPKGVWHHNITESVSRTEEMKELPPGDPNLPKTLPNGDPWPAEAGALKVKMRFNLNTQRGRDAYEDVKFFGGDQEWSIGYNVPTGGATIDRKTGVRTIHHMDLYEYSPVLFGAMPVARTVSVKSAQFGWKVLCGVDNPEFKAALAELEAKSAEEYAAFNRDHADDLETKSGETGGLDVDEPEHPEDVDRDGDADDEPDDDGDEGEVKYLPIDYSRFDAIDTAIKALEDLQDALLDGYTPEGETKAYATKAVSLRNLVKAAGLQAEDTAADFDAAVHSGDLDAMESAGDQVLDAVESALGDDTVDESALHDVTSHIATAFQSVMGKMPSDDEDDSQPDEEKRAFTAARRKEDADRGQALPDGSFPIESEGDLKNAIRAVGRASDSAAAKAHIRKRAKAMGLTDMLPDDWKSDAEVSETKTVVIDTKSFLAALDD